MQTPHPGSPANGFLGPLGWCDSGVIPVRSPAGGGVGWGGVWQLDKVQGTGYKIQYKILYHVWGRSWRRGEGTSPELCLRPAVQGISTGGVRSAPGVGDVADQRQHLFVVLRGPRGIEAGYHRRAVDEIPVCGGGGGGGGGGVC